jgi:hypothetical protein
MPSLPGAPKVRTTTVLEVARALSFVIGPGVRP